MPRDRSHPIDSGYFCFPRAHKGRAITGGAGAAGIYVPRLAGRGRSMSQLGGGIGTRGPGETQIETDRRKIGRKIQVIRNRLEAVRDIRRQQRQRRTSVPVPTVALVGIYQRWKKHAVQCADTRLDSWSLRACLRRSIPSCTWYAAFAAASVAVGHSGIYSCTTADAGQCVSSDAGRSADGRSFDPRDGCVQSIGRRASPRKWKKFCATWKSTRNLA